jgi:hypothetical protein
MQAHPDQFHELDEMFVGYTVEPVQHNIGHKSEQLNQRDAGVAQVMIRPFRRVQRDACAGFFHQIVKRPVI